MLKQVFSQKMLQKLSPQQIQLMKLIQLPVISLEQRIKEELEANPALDEGSNENMDNQLEEEYQQEENQSTENESDFDISDYMDEDIASYKLYSNNSGSDADDTEIPFSGGKTYHELLMGQLDLRMLPENEHQLAEYLVGNLDESGYLRRELSAIVDDLAFSQNIETNEEELQVLLHTIQEFDPAGVGARSLQECLLLQLERRLSEGENIAIAKEILEKCFEAFTKKHFDKICEKLGINEIQLRDAMDEILKLNPKPGNSLNESVKIMEQIIPDFLITHTDGKLELQLNSKNAPELHLNKKYSEMLHTLGEGAKNISKEKKDALLFVKQKLDSAKWFIDAIKQRHHTLLLTMDAVMHYQKEYFMTGDETKLKPMILKDIADIVQMDISTVSRVANSKYVQTPYGTFLIKTFFSESLSTASGEEVSTREVKKILQDLIGAENKSKPITDEKLCDDLKEKGYNIARRTVAKYREQLNIPVARLRKEL